MDVPIRSFLAPNAGPFTLDGTRSYVVGVGRAAIIDPGPGVEAHLQALDHAVGGVADVVILLTHAHEDHAGGAPELARRLRAQAWGPGGTRELCDGQSFDTDAGPVKAVFTPGHARRHFCFHLATHGAVFTGDLVLGAGDTTWVGEYRGGVRDYLESLDRLDALGARTLYPGHGPPLQDPAGAVDRFRRHRLARIDQVRAAVRDGGLADAPSIARRVYGALPGSVFPMAVAGVRAILDHLSDSDARRAP